MTQHARQATVTISAVGGIPEVREGDDLATMLADGLAASGLSLRDGDVLVVSSKIASKALGLVSHDADKDLLIAAETVSVVAERAVPGRVTRVVQAKAGPVMAAAGVDGSNTGERGGWLLLPHDPDAVCRDLVDELRQRFGVRVGVLLSDTAGRPWRLGQMDFALGAHGVRVLDDLRGSRDADGRRLEVTARAVADELAAAADLVKGKAERVPVALVRGLADLVLPADPADPAEPADPADSVDPAIAGARELVRTGPSDWFAQGRVEAIRDALGIPAGSALSERVGIAPAAGDGPAQATARAAAVALHGLPGGTVDAGPGSVAVTADSPYDLGRLVARLEAALWCDWLVVEHVAPAADGRSAVLRVGARVPGAEAAARAQATEAPESPEATRATDPARVSRP